jgi:hypothetical protein
MSSEPRDIALVTPYARNKPDLGPISDLCNNNLGLGEFSANTTFWGGSQRSESAV